MLIKNIIFWVMKMKTKILVSACLLGENCKYSGGNNKNDEVIALGEKYDLVPICPECFAGLPIPRVPSEIKDGRVYSKNGEDLTDEAQIKDNEAIDLVKTFSNEKLGLDDETADKCSFLVQKNGEVIDGDNYVKVIAAEKKETDDGIYFVRFYLCYVC